LKRGGTSGRRGREGYANDAKEDKKKTNRKYKINSKNKLKKQNLP
jgi:hypothetical protein